MSQAAQAIDATLDPQKAIEVYRLFCQKNFKQYTTPDPSKTEKGTHRDKDAIILRTSTGDKLAIVGITKRGLGILWENSPPLQHKPKKRLINPYS